MRIATDASQSNGVTDGAWIRHVGLCKGHDRSSAACRIGPRWHLSLHVHIFYLIVEYAPSILYYVYIVRTRLLGYLLVTLLQKECPYHTDRYKLIILTQALY